MKYFATFIESGTNYRCYIEAETREGIQAKLLGRVYPPKKKDAERYMDDLLNRKFDLEELKHLRVEMEEV